MRYEIIENYVYKVFDDGSMVLFGALEDVREVETNESGTTYIVVYWDVESEDFKPTDKPKYTFKDAEYTLKDGKFTVPKQLNQHEEVTKQTYSTVETTSFDNLINMDMLLRLDEKLNAIIEHLGLIL